MLGAPRYRRDRLHSSFQRVKSLATIRWLVTSTASSEQRKRTGSAITSGERSCSRIEEGSSSGTMPVSVAPPGKSMLTVIPDDNRSWAMMWEGDSAPAREGPYGTKPFRRIVS